MSAEVDDSVARRLVAADVDAVGRIEAVASILEVVCRTTGLRFAAVARVTPTSWTACAVRDEIAFGLKAGGELPLKTTICHEIRNNGTAVVIDEVARDPVYRDHPTPQLYGFQSYISTPIVRTNGEFFGTLCALDPKPANLSDPKVLATFESFSQLISLQLDAEERLQKSQAALLDERQTAELREQFIAVLGHDLRNPLFSVVAGAESLMRGTLTPKAQVTVERIQRSGQRMAKLVDNVMDFARGRLGGGVAITLQPDADVAAALRHVVAELSAVHPDRTIAVDLAIDRPVTCDPARIAQLFSNLLGNALSHGDPEAPVQVKAASRDARFVLSVANEGAPIPRETLDRLFQPFSRVIGDQRTEGLGLGLYIASQIALAHRGTLTVQSTASTTTFTLDMPLAEG